jgi:hypothetical protein
MIGAERRARAISSAASRIVDPSLAILPYPVRNDLEDEAAGSSRD